MGDVFALVEARISVLEATDDRVGLSRASIEAATLSDAVLGDAAKAVDYAESALRIDPRLGIAHNLLRRKKRARTAIAARSSVGS